MDSDKNPKIEENEQAVFDENDEQSYVIDLDSDEFDIEDTEGTEERKRGYKLYNFRRPDKFSKDHLRGLQDIHREFSRQLSMVLTTYLRMQIDVDVVSVDQLTYDEFMRSIPNPISLGIFELNPLPGQILIGISYEVLSSIVDRMLGGVGAIEQNTRELTDIEESLVKKMIERNIQTLGTAWSHVIPVNANLIGLDTGNTNIQIASTGEIVALVTFEMHIARQHYGLVSLCYPYPVLENILDQLTTQHIFQVKGLIATSEERKKMIEKLNTSFIDVSVIFGETEVTFDEILALKEGDVIKLDNLCTDDLIVTVNGEKKFYGRPGKIRNRLCVKVTDRYDDYTNTLRHYF